MPANSPNPLEDMARSAAASAKSAAESHTPASSVAQELLNERYRQISKEHWGEEHDDTHLRGELAQAASTYALHSAYQVQGLDKDTAVILWPWSEDWWKPTTPRRNLIKAGALIIAEIERLDRQDGQHINTEQANG